MRLLAHRIATAIVMLVPGTLAAQRAAGPPPSPQVDSVTVAAGAHYRAGGLHRFLFGGSYRDLWTTPIQVPVLNLRTFAGGLRPLKPAGGLQTKALRFAAGDGNEYVFRSIDKSAVEVPAEWRGTFVEKLGMDNLSNSHPAAAEIADPLLTAAGVLHVHPIIVAMPDDSALGKYRQDFAHRLGMIEVFPTVPKDGPGFAGAIKIVDSDTLRDLLNHEPQEHIDARAFLTARLMDIYMNDWDRHHDQWKWARMRHDPAAAWEPISRDRDHAFVSETGLVQSALRSASPISMRFDGNYGSMKGFTFRSLAFDQRLLAGLEKPVWDSIARWLQQRLTDSVIEAAVHAMPREYQATAPELARVLRLRRDGLPAAATRFYLFLSGVAEVNGTDVADGATITRIDNTHVDVNLASASGETYYHRRFNAGETREIRVYLHDGDDHALVAGNTARSIPVRVIGGNGTNRLTDSSTVAGRHDTAHFYDLGTVSGVNYGVDTLFMRRPLVNLYGRLVAPPPDHGLKLTPIAGLIINHDVGIAPRLGLARYRYGFDHYPYSSFTALDGRYSLKLKRYKVAILADRRFENSHVHLTGIAQASQLEVVNFYGFGNATVVTGDTAFFAVHQRQLLLRPALAIALGVTTDLSLGPIIQYSVTDSLAANFVSLDRPYGFGHFGEAGFRIGLYHDNRVPSRHARHGTVLDIGASYFPAVWDVRNTFEEVDAFGALYFTIPALTRPFVALRAGGKKLFGDFPFQEAAFIGGTTTIRTLNPQRYAGDASLYATAEIRIPVAKFTLLLPLNTGLLATGDIGRVYVKGASPGGWHDAIGAGFWIGFHELTADIRFMRAQDIGKTAVITARIALPGGTPE